MSKGNFISCRAVVGGMCISLQLCVGMAAALKTFWVVIDHSDVDLLQLNNGSSDQRCVWETGWIPVSALIPAHALRAHQRRVYTYVPAQLK